MHHLVGKNIFGTLSRMLPPVRLISSTGEEAWSKMQYLLLIYGNENHFNQMSPAEQEKILQEYGELSKSIANSGHLRGGNELDRISKAKTVRVRGGKRTVTDGPFAETKEQLGGYYLVEAKDLEEALVLAARIPSARWGSIEVRPIIPHEIPK